MRAALAGLSIVLVGIAVVGCNSSGLALVPVSGVVTLNGKPLAGARVMFEPQEGKVAPASSAITDASGRFRLAVAVSGQSGAMVGKHRVKITAAQSEQASSDDTLKKVVEPLPARYNSQSTLSFDVPAGGTQKADFPLTAP